MTATSQFLMNCGMVTSTMSTSLENLFMMRPRGVVSKKDIGARRMFFRNMECRTREQDTHPMAITRDSSKTDSTEKVQIE